MSGNSNSLVTRVIDRFFPRMPDFYGLINEQCNHAVESMQVFVEFMETGDPKKGEQVRQCEHQGDKLKNRNIDILNRAFATPMDREDLYRAIIAIDHVVNYAKTTVREMEVLGVQPDAFTLEMAVLLKQGTHALQRGFAKLTEDPRSAETDADLARKAERSTEKTYRQALAKLFSTEELTEHWRENEPGTIPDAMNGVVLMFKRREIYRHLSNGADRLARAGQVLHDIIVKIS